MNKIYLLVYLIQIFEIKENIYIKFFEIKEYIKIYLNY